MEGAETYLDSEGYEFALAYALYAASSHNSDTYDPVTAHRLMNELLLESSAGEMRAFAMQAAIALGDDFEPSAVPSEALIAAASEEEDTDLAAVFLSKVFQNADEHDVALAAAALDGLKTVLGRQCDEVGTSCARVDDRLFSAESWVWAVRAEQPPTWELAVARAVWACFLDGSEFAPTGQVWRGDATYDGQGWNLTDQIRAAGAIACVEDRLEPPYPPHPRIVHLEVRVR